MRPAVTIWCENPRIQPEQSAKLEVTGTGTSFSAGQTLSIADDKWLRPVEGAPREPR